MLTLGSVEGHIKGAGVDLVLALHLVPYSWHILGVYLQQIMPEFVECFKSGLLPSCLL